MSPPGEGDIEALPPETLAPLMAEVLGEVATARRECGAA
jgi:hypothetical protein